jgi:hypothetical protein
MNDVLLVFGLPIIGGGLLAWAIIQVDPQRRARRAAARAAAPPVGPRSWIDIAAQAWVFGQIARGLVFLIAGIALFWWWLFTR